MRFWILFICLLVSFPVSAAQFRTAAHHDYQRVVFDMGMPFNYTSDVDGKTLVVTFPFNLGVSADAIKRRIPAPFKPLEVRVTATSAWIVFPLVNDTAFKIMTFDNKFVLDLFHAVEMPLKADAKTAVVKVEASALEQISRAAAPESSIKKQIKPLVSFDFSFEQRTALALFERGGVWWVVFDQPLKEPVLLEDETIRSSAVTHDKNITLYTLLLKPNHFMTAKKTKDGWQISVVAERPDLNWRIPVFPVLKKKDPYIFIAQSRMTGPIKMDRNKPFYVFPTYAEGEGLSTPLHFVDLDFLETAQGIVIDPNTKDFVFQKTAFGYDLFGVPGKKLSLATEDAISTYGNFSFLLTDESENTLTKRINSKPTGLDRLKLSALYLSQGDYDKANSSLNALFYSGDPLGQSGFFKFLKGIALFGHGRVNESYAYFIHPTIKDTPESLMWQGLIKRDAAMFGRYRWFERFYPAVLQRAMETYRQDKEQGA